MCSIEGAEGLYKTVIGAIGLPEAINRFSVGATGVLLALSVMWGGWQLINTAGRNFVARTERNIGTMDGIVISLLLVTLKLLLIVAGLFFIATQLSLPYNGVLASLGIGGLAFAFASKETLSNVFGAGILVIDRPFRRGDWIVVGDTAGTVEHVGIRSTRIRTQEDSLVIVPNGKLSDATVNNLGTRRHRLARAKLLIGYETTPEQIEAFTSGMREVAAKAPQVVAGRSIVGVNGLRPEGIEIELTCYFDVRSGSDESTLKTALMLEILRLARRLGVEAGIARPAAPTPVSV
jgi:MscS family membrane protein